MSRFEDFYRHQREWSSSGKQEHRKCSFNKARKERRTRTFDLFRGDIEAYYEPEEIKPISKNTFRDTISKLLRDKKKKVVKKIRPFVVGTVKHKIHSPPFLHGPLRMKEPKKKLIPPMPLQSFAPKNYKFNPPKGLKINFLTPLGDENSTPFYLNTVWNMMDNKCMRKKNVIHQNVTFRSQDRRPARLDSLQNNVFSSGTISKNNEDVVQRTSKKVLWPEDQDDELVFGRLNLYRKQKSNDNLSKDNEKDKSNLSEENHSVCPGSSFDCHKEKSENIQIENLHNGFNFESLAFEATKNSDANTLKAANEYEIEKWVPAEETKMMNRRVSDISPPKIISNTLLNCDDSRIPTGIDATFLEENSCSIPLVTSIFKITSKQVENASDASTVQKTMGEMITLEHPLPIHYNLEETNDGKCSSSAKKETLFVKTRICNNSGIEHSCNEILAEEDTVKEISRSSQNILRESMDSPISPVQESSFNHSNPRIEDDNLMNSPMEKTTSDVAATEDEHKVLNFTYTKYLALIDEDEELEELQPNLGKLNNEREENVYSSPNQQSLNLKNMSEQNANSESLCEGKRGLLSSNDTQKLNDNSSVIENNSSGKYTQKSSEKQLNHFAEISSSAVVSDHTNSDEDGNLNSTPKAPVKTVLNINIESNSDEISDDHYQVEESKSLMASSDSTSSNNLMIIEAQTTEVIHEKSESNHNMDSINETKKSSSKPRCNKLCCQVDISPISQIKAKNGSVVKARDSFNTTDIAKTVSNQTLIEMNTLKKESLDSNITIKVTSSTGLEETLLQAAANNEVAHAGTMQSRASISSIPVINLTDSPIQPVKRMSIKPGFRKSTPDYKSPILLSIQKHNTIQLNSDENEVVDLVSDDEEDYTFFVDRVIKKYMRNSKSPQKSPRSRIPLASIGNISRLNLSPYRTPQSPLVNSPAKRTPVSLVQTIPMVQISPTTEPLDNMKDVSSVKMTLETQVVKKAQVFHDTPRKTPRRPKGIQEIGIETEDVPSPLRVMSLRTRNVSVSPSPKKMTPRKTPVRHKVSKEVETEVNKATDDLRMMNLKEMNIGASSTPKKIITQVDIRKTPIRRNVVKEVATEVHEDTSLLRVMSLRSRNISVSPSPKKMTPRRRKNNNQCA